MSANGRPDMVTAAERFLYFLYRRNLLKTKHVTLLKNSWVEGRLRLAVVDGAAWFRRICTNTQGRSFVNRETVYFRR